MEVGKNMKAIIVTGLRNKGEADHIQSDLEEAGYEVEVYAYKDRNNTPPPNETDIAVGHSAGATFVEEKYGGQQNTTVVSLNSPTGIQSSNIIHSRNLLDVVSLGGIIVSKNPFTGTFINFSGDPHSKDEAWDQVRSQVI